MAADALRNRSVVLINPHKFNSPQNAKVNDGHPRVLFSVNLKSRNELFSSLSCLSQNQGLNLFQNLRRNRVSSLVYESPSPVEEVYGNFSSNHVIFGTLFFWRSKKTQKSKLFKSDSLKNSSFVHNRLGKSSRYSYLSSINVADEYIFSPKSHLSNTQPNKSAQFSVHRLSKVSRSIKCSAIFPKWFQGANDQRARDQKGGRESEEGEDEGNPTIPPNPWELDKEDVVEDSTPYIPEVDEKASLKLDVLKELASKGATAIRVENVSKTFVTRSVGARQVVQDVNVSVDPGKMVALVGTSGSGKTTLMRIIAGLETPTTGNVYFDEKDMTNVKVQDRDVGVMFQSYALFKHMTVKENIGYGLRTNKRKGEVSQEKIAQRVNDLLDLVQLSEFGDRYPPQLSGGQRQRVALARALATQPRVLLLDEPFGALDTIVRQELRSWVRKLQVALQITTIFVTHDQEEALEMADFMIVFHRGKIIQMGPPFEVFQRPNSPFVMNFMCDPNIFPATSLAVRRSGLRTSKPHVLVRPDDAVIFFKERRELNTTPATVTLVNNMGSEVELELSYDDGEKLEFVRQRYDWEDEPFEIGQRLHIQLKPLLLMPFSPEDLRP